MPKKVKRGRSSLRLATMSAQTLAERPFEVVGGPIPWPVRLALGAGALLAIVALSPYFVYQALRHNKYVGSLRPRLGSLPVSFNLDGDASIWLQGDLDDAARWRFMRHIVSLNQPPTSEPRAAQTPVSALLLSTLLR